MTRRLLILTEIISPYRIPLFNALARHPEAELHVVFMAETDPQLRQWRVYKEEIKFSYEVLPSWRRRIGGRHALLNRGVGRALSAFGPNVILCGGYNYLASWQALLWAKVHNVPLLLWSESHRHELRRVRPLVEFLKDEFLHRCNGFVVPGLMAREYIQGRNIKDDVIFTAPNAVENDLFAAVAADARRNARERRMELNLPDRYFLFAGRLVREKGVFELLSAYAKLDEQIRRQMGLVFVGDGASRQELEEQAKGISPGMIRFAGFAHREQLAVYYALADVMVLPTYTDTWGLVVNEGMACGSPVILSRAAGCAADLLKENWNGLLVPPRDIQSLASAMKSIASQPDLRAKMAANSLDQISHYSAEEWSMGILRAMEAVGGGGE
jgi:glycosyltransferase involved in cell wall biosynthesis